jgi:hypothetical protein
MEQAKTDTEPFDLTQIPFEALRRVGMIFREGERKYERNNWRHGQHNQSFQLERLNHALKHLLLYIHQFEHGEHLGEQEEDDLAKAAWGCLTQMELERMAKADHAQPDHV